MPADFDLDLEFGNLKIVCDIPSNYGKLFVKFEEFFFSFYFKLLQRDDDL